jgi:hypothetical protein
MLAKDSQSHHDRPSNGLYEVRDVHMQMIAREKAVRASAAQLLEQAASPTCRSSTISFKIFSSSSRL